MYRYSVCVQVSPVVSIMSLKLFFDAESNKILCIVFSCQSLWSPLAQNLRPNLFFLMTSTFFKSPGQLFCIMCLNLISLIISHEYFKTKPFCFLQCYVLRSVSQQQEHAVSFSTIGNVKLNHLGRLVCNLFLHYNDSGKTSSWCEYPVPGEASLCWKYKLHGSLQNHGLKRYLP